MGYDQAAWSGFAGTLGAVAGALAGLLFVAISIKSDVLSASQNLRSARTGRVGTDQRAAATKPSTNSRNEVCRTPKVAVITFMSSTES
jgi:hypothetical protein